VELGACKRHHAVDHASRGTSHLPVVVHSGIGDSSAAGTADAAPVVAVDSLNEMAGDASMAPGGRQRDHAEVGAAVAEAIAHRYRFLPLQAYLRP